MPSWAGKGAFGVVRLVVDKKTGQAFACKSISKAKLISKEDVDDVRREVEILNLVSPHPTVAGIKQVGGGGCFVLTGAIGRAAGGRLELVVTTCLPGSTAPWHTSCAFTAEGKWGEGWCVTKTARTVHAACGRWAACPLVVYVT